MITNRLFLAVALAATAPSAAANLGGVGATRPPRAHELDESYTFELYLSHFDKSYDTPDEHERRSAIFARNLEAILRHNEGRMDGSGEVVSGYVMGVNAYTDLDVDELPMGYNKASHSAWTSQINSGGVSSVERRRLGEAGYDTTAHSVSLLFRR